MRKGLVFLIFVFAFQGISHGELSITYDHHGDMRPFFSTENGLIWTKIRQIPDELVLNQFGDRLGDQVPVFMLSPVEDLAFAVWAMNEGDYEIVYSKFEEGAWSDPINISNDHLNDVQPTIDIDSIGNLFIAWQKEYSNIAQIFASGISAGTHDIVHPIRISDGLSDATAPSLKAVGEDVFVAYQETEITGDDFIIILKVNFKRYEDGVIVGNGGGAEGCIGRVGEIVVNHLDGNGGGIIAKSANPNLQRLTSRAPTVLPDGEGRLARHPTGDGVRPGVQLHYNGCILWADWVNTKTTMGFSVYDPYADVFGESMLMDLDDLSNVPEAREAIESFVNQLFGCLQDEGSDELSDTEGEDDEDEIGD